MSYEVTNFEKDVIEASRTTPVVIDFWAEWCGPCRQLGPTIEKLAEQANGRWKLVKINTDRHPDIAIQYGVRGIPAVKMIYQDEVIAEFTGAQPEHIIKKWLNENLPDGQPDESGSVMEQVKKLLAEGNREEAKAVLADVVTEDSDPETIVRYAMLLLPDQIDTARQWMERIPEEVAVKFDIAFQVVDTVEHLGQVAAGTLKPEGPDRVVQLYEEAASHLFDNEFELALPKFIECLQMDRQFADDGARKACIACFQMLGEQHPLSIQYRRSFSMSLY